MHKLPFFFGGKRILSCFQASSEALACILSKLGKVLLHLFGCHSIQLPFSTSIRKYAASLQLLSQFMISPFAFFFGSLSFTGDLPALFAMV
jgi:hypothetical protein